jgi:hypothetical protein
MRDEIISGMGTVEESMHVYKSPGRNQKQQGNFNRMVYISDSQY